MRHYTVTAVPHEGHDKIYAGAHDTGDQYQPGFAYGMHATQISVRDEGEQPTGAMYELSKEQFEALKADPRVRIDELVDVPVHGPKPITPDNAQEMAKRMEKVANRNPAEQVVRERMGSTPNPNEGKR